MLKMFVYLFIFVFFFSGGSFEMQGIVCVPQNLQTGAPPPQDDILGKFSPSIIKYVTIGEMLGGRY